MINIKQEIPRYFVEKDGEYAGAIEMVSGGQYAWRESISYSSFSKQLSTKELRTILDKVDELNEKKWVCLNLS